MYFTKVRNQSHRATRALNTHTYTLESRSAKTRKNTITKKRKKQNQIERAMQRHLFLIEAISYRNNHKFNNNSNKKCLPFVSVFRLLLLFPIRRIVTFCSADDCYAAVSAFYIYFFFDCTIFRLISFQTISFRLFAARAARCDTPVTFISVLISVWHS